MYLPAFCNSALRALPYATAMVRFMAWIRVGRLSTTGQQHTKLCLPISFRSQSRSLHRYRHVPFGSWSRASLLSYFPIGRRKPAQHHTMVHASRRTKVRAYRPPIHTSSSVQVLTGLTLSQKMMLLPATSEIAHRPRWKILVLFSSCARCCSFASLNPKFTPSASAHNVTL